MSLHVFFVNSDGRLYTYVGNAGMPDAVIYAVRYIYSVRRSYHGLIYHDVRSRKTQALSQTSPHHNFTAYIISAA